MGLRQLFNRNFTLLWLGLSISQIGDWAGLLGVMWWVQAETGSAIGLGLLAMAGTIPRVLLGPLGGTIADRFNRKWLIVSMDVVRGVIYLSLSWLAVTEVLSLPLLLGLIALASTASQFFFPSVMSAVPTLVPSHLLERANSMNQLTNSLTSVVGTAVSGILIASFGVPAMLLINGTAYLLSAVSESFILLPHRTKPAQQVSVWSDMVAGWRYMTSQWEIFNVARLSMLMNFFVAPLMVLLPKFVAEDLGSGPEVLAYMFSMIMLGSFIGLTIMSLTTVVQRHRRLREWGVFIQGLLLVVFALTPPGQLWVAFAAMLTFGVFNAFVNILIVTAIQRWVDNTHMGRVFGVLGSMTGAMQPLAQGLSGLLAELSVRVVLAGGGAGISVGGLVLARTNLRRILDPAAAPVQSNRTEGTAPSG